MFKEETSAKNKFQSYSISFTFLKGPISCFFFFFPHTLYLVRNKESAFPVFSIAFCNLVKIELFKRLIFLHSWLLFLFFFSPEYVLSERHEDFALIIFMH